MKNTFENYLQKIHMEQNPEILDDDLPDSFDTWLTDLQVDEVIAYAEAWGKELQKPGWTEAEMESYEKDREKRIHELLEAAQNCSHYEGTCFCPETAMELGRLGYEFTKSGLTELEDKPF